MRLQFANNPAYNRYEKGLILLHQFLMEGKNDTPEIDPIHEDLDDCTPYLDAAEVQRLGGLSADLYMIQGKEIFEETDLTAEQIKERCAEASQREDWEAALTLLRTGKIVTSPPELAALRAFGAYGGEPPLPTLCRKVCRAECYRGVHLPQNAREEAKAARGCRGFNRVTT